MGKKRTLITSRTSTGKSRQSSSIIATAREYLGPRLPTGWQAYFSVRRAGKYWGLSIVCPFCKDGVPPSKLLGQSRWRWLTVHVAEKHGRGNPLKGGK